MMRRALERTRFVNNSLEKAPDRRICKRPAVGAFYVGQNFVFSFRLVNRQSFSMLLVPDFKRAARSLVEQLDQLLIEFVYAATPIINAHGVCSLPG